MEERIIELETKLAYAEGTIEDLSGELYRFTLKVDRLEKLVESLKDQFVAISDSQGGRSLEDDIPPHY